MTPNPDLIYLAAPAFAGLDRLFGSDFKWKGRSGHSVATLGAFALAVPAWFVASPYASAACVLWAGYRSLNNSGGAMAPVGGAQVLTAFGRHLIMAVVLAGLLALQHQGLDWRMMLGLAYATAATTLAAENGEDQGRHNYLVEAGRGLLYGLTMARQFHT